MPAARGHFSWRRVTMPIMQTVSRLLFALGLAAALATVSAQEAQTNLARTKLAAGMHQIDAQLAQNNEQRMVGLMYRKEMPQHEGMLFTFDQPSKQCFWMKNTLLPLTAAFIDDDGTVVNLEDMKPQTLESHCSAKPVRYVLEMNQGWFAKKGIKPGFKITGAPFSK
ncbi:MAG: DUF192 domain-containing protein [Burkholderiales bacterium]|nr:DUF192 domain-containing protein [Burkholderiales bacterium]